jgi:protein-disulfide isomerase
MKNFKHLLSWAAAAHSKIHTKLTVPAAIVLAACILGASHIVYGMVSQGQPRAAASYFSGKPVDSSDFVEGKKDSRVFVVEYSDPECPYCVSLHPTMKQLRNDFGGSVAFVYRHYPLTQIHRNAFDESKAIQCAGTLGGAKKLYEYVDVLYGYKFGNQTTELPASGKEDAASLVGLDKDSFAACVQSDAAAQAVNMSVNDGTQAGVDGTPTTFVLSETRKGYEIVATIVGAQQYDYFKAAIEQALSK